MRLLHACSFLAVQLVSVATLGATNEVAYWVTDMQASSREQVVVREQLGGASQEIYRQPARDGRVAAIAVDAENQIVFIASAFQIIAIPMDLSRRPRLIVVDDVGPIWALSCDPARQRLFWTSLFYVRSVNYDGSDVETVFHGNSFCAGVAVDSTAGAIYWSTFEALGGLARLYVMAIERREPSIIAQIPHSLILDIGIEASRREVFFLVDNLDWTPRYVASYDPAIQRLARFPASPLASPIALEVSHGRLYSAGFRTITRWSLDGSNSETIATTQEIDDLTSAFAVTVGADTDADGVFDGADVCVFVSDPEQADVDDDTIGDACDNCLHDPNVTQADADTDGFGDACDNCPQRANATQADGDYDGFGDACDNCALEPNMDQRDEDGDGAGEACDNCPSRTNSDQADRDSDTLGDACDNCPSVPNPNQADTDRDRSADACDNCPRVYNPWQGDFDYDGLGDACDEDADDDGVSNDDDKCRYTYFESPVNAVGCPAGDIDGDRDADLVDFSLLQLSLTGPTTSDPADGAAAE